MSKAQITSKGQMTIPVEVRRALGLDKGDTVTIEVVSDAALMRKAGSAASLRGSVPSIKLSWQDARRKAWRARSKRIARPSSTRTSSSGS